MQDRKKQKQETKKERQKDRNKERNARNARKIEVHTPGLGLSQHLSVLHTRGTEKEVGSFFVAHHMHAFVQIDSRDR